MRFRARRGSSNVFWGRTSSYTCCDESNLTQRRRERKGSQSRSVLSGSQCDGAVVGASGKRDDGVAARRQRGGWEGRVGERDEGDVSADGRRRRDVEIDD